LDTLDPNDISYSAPNVLDISNLSSSSSNTSSDSGLIQIVIPLTSINLLTASCRFWNETLLDGAGNWSTTGCEVYQRNDTFIICACSHLTIFNSFLPPINLPISISADDLLKHPEGNK
jgi:hypothetical protein